MKCVRGARHSRGGRGMQEGGEYLCPSCPAVKVTQATNGNNGQYRRLQNKRLRQRTRHESLSNAPFAVVSLVFLPALFFAILLPSLLSLLLLQMQIMPRRYKHYAFVYCRSRLRQRQRQQLRQRQHMLVGDNQRFWLPLLQSHNFSLNALTVSYD